MAAKLAESEQLSRNFLMSVSHELRTPLTAIRGHVSALREGVIDDPLMQEASLGVIGEEALRLERLVGDVLDLAKLDAHRFTVLQEEVDMERLSRARVRGLRRGGAAARDRLPPRRAREAGDRHRRRPRAADHLEPALERVSLDAGGRPGRARAVRGATARSRLRSRTRGRASTAEERDRIFRPFWSRDGGGTGLGLAIARELAVALGGQIVLDSSPGSGQPLRLVAAGLARDAIDGSAAVIRGEPRFDR